MQLTALTARQASSNINMKKIFSSPLLRYSILTVLAIVIGINLFSLSSSQIAGDAMPMPFGFGLSAVLTGSMEPEISAGDLLIVREEGEYKVGDVVVYQNGNTPVVHRILDISGEMVTTKGDANNTTDAPFHIDRIKGRVALAIPVLGSLFWALKSPVALVMMLVTAILLIELSVRREKARKRAEQEGIKTEIRKLIDELKED